MRLLASSGHEAGSADAVTGVVRLDDLAALGAVVRGGSRLGGPEAVSAHGVGRVARREWCAALPGGDGDKADVEQSISCQT